MKIYTLLMAVLFLVLAPVLTAAEDSITVEGDGLDLVREYRIEGDETKLVSLNNDFFDSLITSEDTQVNSMSIEWGQSYLHNSNNTVKLIFINNNYEIENIVEGEHGEICTFQPLGNNASYVKNFQWGASDKQFFAKKQVYGPKNELLASFDNEGYIKPFQSGEIFLVVDFSGFLSKIISINIANLQGGISEFYNVSTDNDMVYGGFCSTFDKGKDWFAVSGPYGIDRKAYPDISFGTKIYDNTGKFLFTLNKTTYSEGYRLENNKFYGSESCICQIGVPGNITSKVDKEEYLYLDYGEILEVYDGNGNFKWQYHSPVNETRAYFGVSENEEHLVLGLGTTNSVIVFKTETGEKLYHVDGAFISASKPSTNYIETIDISNDASLLVFSVRNTSRNDKTLYIYKNGTKTASIQRVEDEFLTDYSVDVEKRVVIVGYNDTLTIYSIK